MLMILMTGRTAAGCFRRLPAVTTGAVIPHRHQHLCSVSALAGFFVTRLAGKIAVLGVGELGLEEPARGDLRRLGGQARAGPLEDVALAALDLDHLLGVED